MRDSHRNDYKVTLRWREDIRRYAEEIRRRSGTAELTTFNLMDVFRQMQRGRVLKKGVLIIDYFEKGEADPPAYVKYNPLRLFIDPELEELMDMNESQARFIGAHELGHIFLHDGDTQLFSGQMQRWMGYDEHSAEWQANTFADHFLLSDAHMGGRLSPIEMAINYAIPYHVVERRLRGKGAYTGKLAQSAETLVYGGRASGYFALRTPVRIVFRVA